MLPLRDGGRTKTKLTSERNLTPPYRRIFSAVLSDYLLIGFAAYFNRVVHRKLYQSTIFMPSLYFFHLLK